MNFHLKKLHGFSLTELEEMYPFERDAYLILLRQWLEEEAKKNKA